MYIWLKTSARHTVDPRVMKEGIDENHPWVTDDDAASTGCDCVYLDVYIHSSLNLEKTQQRNHKRIKTQVCTDETVLSPVNTG